MSDGKTYFDAEAEAKAKQRKQEQGSDTPEYILRQPIAIEPEKVFNGQVYELPFRQWGMKNNHSCVSQETLDEHFTPLDVEALRQQIREEIREYAESMLPDWGVPIHKTERLDSVVDAVLRVCGLTQEEQ
jgi:hypothetical protein